MPANSGYLKIKASSPVSKFAQSKGEIVDSFRRISEIFPFVGDASRRRGAIFGAAKQKCLKDAG